MIVVLAATVGALLACGSYLIMQRSLSRMVIGFGLVGHGVNLLILAAGGRAGAPPIIGDDGSAINFADPLPQAFALTAIVISFGMLAFLMTLAFRSYQLTSDDEAQDDIEDRRIAAMRYREDEELDDLAQLSDLEGFEEGAE